MLNFLQLNGGTILLTAVLVLAVVSIIRYLVRQKRQGSLLLRAAAVRGAQATAIRNSKHHLYKGLQAGNTAWGPFMGLWVFVSGFGQLEKGSSGISSQEKNAKSTAEKNTGSLKGEGVKECAIQDLAQWLGTERKRRL